MSAKILSISRARQILTAAAKTRILVLGNVMLDQFIWGGVSRISPEAPVPMVDFERESFMPGGAANVARNLTALHVPTELFGAVGHDDAARRLKNFWPGKKSAAAGWSPTPPGTRASRRASWRTSSRSSALTAKRATVWTPKLAGQLLAQLKSKLACADAVIVGDYGKGVVTQPLLDEIKSLCRARGVWLSLDPKPVHHLNLSGLSLITPNRKETFELADLPDETRNADPLADKNLMLAAQRLLIELHPAALLITLGELGMLLCQRGQKPFHIPTVAQEVFDVSGAGDTVIATFTLAIAAGASPLEAAILSNHAAGIVVGKIGTATTTPEELLKSFDHG